MKKLILALLLTSSLDANAVGFADPLRIWNKTTLTTCFADRVADLRDPEIALRLLEKTDDANEDTFDSELFAPFPEVLMADIENSVTVTFSSTPLRFIGWKKCSETPSADIYVTYSLHQKIILGAGSVGDPSKMPSSLRKKTKNSIRINQSYIDAHRFPDDKELSDRTLQEAITHEFAHIAGIQHEHMRADGLKINRKIDLSDAELADYLQERSHTLQDPKAIGAFDALSVSNYLKIYLTPYLYRLRAHCKPAVQSVICDLEKIEALLPHLDSVRGYFSKGDIETMNYLYLGTPVTDSWVPESNALIKWLDSIKDISLILMPKP